MQSSLSIRHPEQESLRNMAPPVKYETLRLKSVRVSCYETGIRLLPKEVEMCSRATD